MVGILCASLTDEPTGPQPLVIVKPVPTGTKIVFKDDPVPTMPESCQALVDAAVAYDRAAGEFYQRTGQAVEKLRLARGSIADPVEFDKALKEYEAFEVQSFTDPTTVSSDTSAQRMADFIMSYQRMEVACKRDVSAQGR